MGGGVGSRIPELCFNLSVFGVFKTFSRILRICSPPPPLAGGGGGRSGCRRVCESSPHGSFVTVQSLTFCNMYTHIHFAGIQQDGTRDKVFEYWVKEGVGGGGVLMDYLHSCVGLLIQYQMQT